MHHAVKKPTERWRHWWEERRTFQQQKKRSSESSERNSDYQTESENFQSSLNLSLMLFSSATAVTQSEALNTKFTKRSFEAVNVDRRAAPEVSHKTGEDREVQVSTQSSAEVTQEKKLPEVSASRHLSLPSIRSSEATRRRNSSSFRRSNVKAGFCGETQPWVQSSELHHKQGQTSSTGQQVAQLQTCTKRFKTLWLQARCCASYNMSTGRLQTLNLKNDTLCWVWEVDFQHQTQTWHKRKVPVPPACRLQIGYVVELPLLSKKLLRKTGENWISSVVCIQRVKR